MRNEAFDKKNLTSVTIPNSVIRIRDSVFSGCTGLTSLTIGSSVISMGIGAFYGCTSLTSVTFEGTIPFNSSTFPSGDLEAKYRARNGGGPGTYTRPSGSSNTWTKR